MLRDLLEDMEDGDGVRLETTELARPTQAEEARFGQPLHGRGAEVSISLGLGGILPKKWTKLSRRVDQRIPGRVNSSHMVRIYSTS